MVLQVVADLQEGVSRTGPGTLRQPGRAQNSQVLVAFSHFHVQVPQCLDVTVCVHRSLFLQSLLFYDFNILKIVFL